MYSTQHLIMLEDISALLPSWSGHCSHVFHLNGPKGTFSVGLLPLPCLPPAQNTLGTPLGTPHRWRSRCGAQLPLAPPAVLCSLGTTVSILGNGDEEDPEILP